MVSHRPLGEVHLAGYLRVVEAVGDEAHDLPFALGETGECRLVSLVSKAAAEQWQAAAWHLERKFPDRWGRKERLDVTVDSAADKAQTTAAILAGFFGAKEDEAAADLAAPDTDAEPDDSGDE